MTQLMPEDVLRGSKVATHQCLQCGKYMYIPPEVQKMREIIKHDMGFMVLRPEQRMVFVAQEFKKRLV